MIISVGDALSKALVENKVFPKVIIIDNKTMRGPIEPFVAEGYELVRFRNDQGTISEDAWKVLAAAIKDKNRVQATVEGEEDLLALVAILECPEGAFVVYGQPREGIVVVKVTSEKKVEIRRIVDSMKLVSKS